MIIETLLTQAEIDLICAFRRTRTVRPDTINTQLTLTPIEVDLIQALRSMPQVKSTQITLSQTEVDLIQAFRHAQHVRANVTELEPKSDVVVMSLLTAISYIVDGLPVGYIRHVMNEGSCIFINNSHFSKDTARFQAEVTTLR